MTLHDFHITYATYWMDQYGTKILFYPPNIAGTSGGMETTYKNGQTIGGTYTLRQENGNWYLGWYGKEFLFAPTDKGFKLFVGDTEAYNFTTPT